MLKRAYHAALMLQSGGRGLPCALPGGEIVRVLPAHRHLSWNRAEYVAFRAVVTTGTVALDVGANVGAYAMVLGQWVGPAGAVYAFEPGPKAFAGLVGHVALNGLGQIVRPVMSAVGGEEAIAPLIVDGPSGECRLAGDAEAAPPLGRARAASGTATPRTIETPVTTIDRFCAAERIEPAFVKIDVEGWELAVLRGARDTIRRLPHLALFVEMHPSIWPILGVTPDEVMAELDAQSLTIETLTPGGDAWAVEGVSVRLRRR